MLSDFDRPRIAEPVMGKLTISMAIFNSYVKIYQRVTCVTWECLNMGYFSSFSPSKPLDLKGPPPSATIRDMKDSGMLHDTPTIGYHLKEMNHGIQQFSSNFTNSSLN